MYVYNDFSFLLASQARLGNERAGEEGRSGISLAKRYSKRCKTPLEFSGLEHPSPR